MKQRFIVRRDLTNWAVIDTCSRMASQLVDALVVDRWETRSLARNHAREMNNRERERNVQH